MFTLKHSHLANLDKLLLQAYCVLAGILQLTRSVVVVSVP
jgi:hypothetical protein